MVSVYNCMFVYICYLQLYFYNYFIIYFNYLFYELLNIHLNIYLLFSIQTLRIFTVVKVCFPLVLDISCSCSRQHRDSLVYQWREKSCLRKRVIYVNLGVCSIMGVWVLLKGLAGSVSAPAACCVVQYELFLLFRIWFLTIANFSDLWPYSFTSVFPPFLTFISPPIHYLACEIHTAGL